MGSVHPVIQAMSLPPGKSGYAEAFSSGVILVDIQTTDANDNEEQVAAMIDAVSSSSLIQGNLKSNSLSLLERVERVNHVLQTHYSDDKYQPVFLFGQWVESAYLLSRVALVNNDASVMVSALNNLPKISGLLEKTGYLSDHVEKDLARLEDLRKQQNLTREQVSKASSILLKLRTLGSQIRG